MPEPCGGNKSHGIPGIFHLQYSHLRICGYIHFLLCYQNRGSFFHCLRRCAVAVKIGAFYTNKQTSLCNFSGIVYDIGYIQFRCSPHYRNIQILK